MAVFIGADQPLLNGEHRQGLSATATMNLWKILFTLQSFALVAFSTVTMGTEPTDVESGQLPNPGHEKATAKGVESTPVQEAKQEERRNTRINHLMQVLEVRARAEPLAPAPEIKVSLVPVTISAECKAAVKKMDANYCLYPSIHRLLHDATFKTRTRNAENSRNYIEVYVKNSLRGSEFNDVYWAKKALVMFFTCRDAYPTGWDLWSELPMFHDPAMVLKIKKGITDLEIIQWYNSILSLKPQSPPV
ncbi:hypothetical protein PSACC_02201 [Paramicrosporidium saccamoebae]|uniref:Uncharacterized protein n=1 Tax=Paramicrosporidium saccamoebae TaxID=1246581 RepID=A0A2H9TJH1_9FUNG|nr:hypothetical protein PSACC_02201 [Paramicrosporidium saccamoebae]